MAAGDVGVAGVVAPGAAGWPSALEGEVNHAWGAVAEAGIQDWVYMHITETEQSSHIKDRAS